MRRSNLPAEFNRFVGRSGELAELRRLLDRSRLVTVVGAGGVGKSRLVLRGAAAARHRYADGAALAELALLRDPELLDHEVAGALGLTDHTSRSPRDVLAEHLAERRLLLVLDGFEHLVEPCAALVRDLLRRCPGLTVLAAGRRTLRLDGEAVQRLDPMAQEDAVRLFADRAAGTPGFRTADPGSVAELCRRLDGIPLALELAAGRLPALSVEQVLHRLDDRFRLLSGGRRGALPRHQTMRTAVGWSHELCAPRERLLWARLSVFPGPFDLDAAEYVCAGAGLPADEVLEVLEELLAQSVVAREDTSAGVRFRMLDTLRAYGAEWLEAMGDTARMRRRHRDWYMGLATWCELDWFSARQPEVAATTESALPHLRAAIELCLEDPHETHLAQHLAGTLWFYWVGCGRLAEGRHWLDRAVAQESAEPAHDEARLKALWVLGYVAVLQGDGTGAVGALHECREGAARTGNPVAAAYSTHRLGCLALLSDDMPRAEELLRRALGQYAELGELNSNVLMGRVELAMALAFQGDLAAAVEVCEEVRAVCAERGELWTRAYALYVLAYAAWTRGEHGRARELLAECIAIDHAFHDLVGLVLAVELLALVTACEGDPAEAAVLQGAAAPVWESVGVQLFGSGYFGAPRAVCERTAGEALGAEGYARCRAKGAELGLDALVERALARREEPPVARGAGQRAVPQAREARRGPHKRKPAGSPTGNGGETAG
ncbi:AAA family ATPase [Streptomyces sp. NPDC001941]|uniref:ATP-binding protein n=1 Tax=Streptomyces sp. NPDC001941 TaxID=3154659 RepID=UPI003331E22C